MLVDLLPLVVVVRMKLAVRSGHRLSRLRENLAGDVKKLTASENKYRLGVGNFRVLFRLEGRRIAVYSVKDRKEAYE